MNLVDINGNSVNSFIIDGEIVKGYKNNNPTTSLNAESCSALGYNFVSGVCSWSVSIGNSANYTVVNDNTPFIVMNSEDNASSKVDLDYLVEIDSDVIDIASLRDNFMNFKVFLMFYTTENNSVEEVLMFDSSSLTQIIDGVYVSGSKKSDVVNVLSELLGSGLTLTNKRLNFSDALNLPTNKALTYAFSLRNSINGFKLRVDNFKITNTKTQKKYTLDRGVNKFGFEFKKVIDNKKSWVDGTKERIYDNNNSITDYSVSDERLVLNTKELDLEFSKSNYLNELFYQAVKQTYVDSLFFSNSTNIDERVLIKNILKLLPNETDMRNYAAFSKYIKTYMCNPRTYLVTSRNMRLLTMLNYYGTYDFVNKGVEVSELFINNISDKWIETVEQLVPSTAIWRCGVRHKLSVFSIPDKYKYPKYCLIPNSSELIGIGVSKEYRASVLERNETSGDTYSYELRVNYKTASYGFGGSNKTPIYIQQN